MNSMATFFRRKFRTHGYIFFLAALCGLASCGEEDVEPTHFNPISPLPLRIDVTATPVPPAISSSGQTPKDQEPTPTPLAEGTPLQTTPTPVVKDNSTGTPTPSPTPVKEKPTPTSAAPKTKTPAATPEPTATPQVVKTTQEAVENQAEPADEADPAEGEQADAPAEAEVSDEAAAPLVTSYGMTIDTLMVCAKISNRKPVECGREFSLSDIKRIYTWMKLSDVKPPKVLKHAYYRDGKFVSSVKLKIRHAATRTWSQKTFKPAEAVGQWKVVITTDKDKVLAVREFTVVP